MRHLGFIAVVSIAVACAVQNNPTPDFEGNGGDAGASAGGSGTAGKATGGVAQGGSVGKAGSSAGGTSSNGGSGGDLADVGGGGSTSGAGGMSGGGGKAGSGGASGSGGKGGAGGAAGGSAGNGGKGGSGGTSGNAGSGGGSNCTPSSSGPIQGLSARYLPEIAGNGTSIGAQLELYNAGPSTLNLADLKLRYYLTNEVKVAVNTNINWAWYRPVAGGGQDDKKPKILFAIVPMSCATASADSYLEFTFTADAGLLEAAHYLLFSFTSSNNNNQSFTQTNDYSFNAAAKIDTDDTAIVILQNSGTRVWGTEP